MAKSNNNINSKKEDHSKCTNYTGIHILNPTYKIHSKIMRQESLE